MLDPNIGMVNYYLGILGLPHPLDDATPWVWVTLVGVTVWWTLGFNAIIYLAGLQDIPRELYEAAQVDGASRWQQFRYVTLPGLRPVLLFVLTVDDPGLGEHVRAVVHHDPGGAGQRRPGRRSCTSPRPGCARTIRARPRRWATCWPRSWSSSASLNFRLFRASGSES